MGGGKTGGLIRGSLIFEDRGVFITKRGTPVDGNENKQKGKGVQK